MPLAFKRVSSRFQNRAAGPCEVMLSGMQRETESAGARPLAHTCAQHGRASPIVLRVLAVQILSCGALCSCPEVLGGRTGAYEWNKCAINVRMAAFTTHKREEVSVEELRAMQYSQRE